MSPPRPPSPTILLLQARAPDDPMREEERRSFAAKAGLDPERITPHDLLASAPSIARVRAFDALMVGGSGEYHVSRDDLPHAPALLDVLREVAATGHPTFASCFGFQLLIAALGGRVVHDPDSMEVGTYELELTEAGRADRLFGALPPRFRAQCGRKDRAADLPGGLVHLASSARCPYHAVRVPGRPVWSTQFHPELDRAENRARFLRYLDGYGAHMSVAAQRRALDRFADSPETERLIPRFLDLVFG